MKNKTTAGILALLLGGVGVHRFYLGQIGLGILYLVFCFTFIPAVIALVDGIIILTKSDDEFNEKYNKGKMPVNRPMTSYEANEINPYRATHFYPTLAGFQHHNASRLIDQLTPGTELQIRRDPQNEHDKNAVEVYYAGQKLGFLPKEYSNSFANQIDLGDPFSLKVYSYDPEQSDYFKLKMELIDLDYFSKVKRVVKDSNLPE